MASDSIIQIILKAKNQASQALRAPIKDLKDLQGALKGISGPMKIATASVAAAFGIAAKKSLEYIDSIEMARQKTDMTSEEFSRLAYNAKLSDLDVSVLSKSIRNLWEGMIDAINGTGDASLAFRAMGISVKNTDGSLKSSQQVLNEIADVFEKMPNGINKSTLASAIFGAKVGTELIPMLNQGSAGFAKMAAESDALGQTISNKGAANVEALNDNLQRMQDVMSGVVNKIVQDLAPTMRIFTDSLINAYKEGGSFKTVIESISWVFTNLSKVIVYGVQAIAMAFGILGKAIGDIAYAAYQFYTGDWKGVAETIKASLSDSQKAVEEGVASLDALISGRTATTGETMASNLINPSLAGLDKLQKQEESAKKEKEKQEKREQAEREKNFRLHGQRLTNEELMQLNQRKQANRDAWANIAALAENGNKTLGAIGKAAAIRNAIMDAYASINVTLRSVPFPLNVISAAAIGAQAFANVQSIRGVAHGGLANVPREGTYLLDEGERVLSPSENQAYSGGGGMATIYLQLDKRTLSKVLVDMNRQGYATA
jgi:hypothetical protein